MTLTATAPRRTPPAILELVKLADAIEASVLPGGSHETKDVALKLAALVKTLLGVS